ncbi:MAG: hypothetical protein R3338_00650, partial [Thermoanaerobaculia bacterium]|nr:hypothetical protein [Thermoanaerobaculia bacterium]
MIKRLARSVRPDISLLLVMAALAAPAAEPVPGAVDAARDHREKHAARILREYAALLEVPNVGSDSENIRRNAEIIRDLFAERGARMELLEVEGAPPIVYGRLDAPDADRTLGIYLHYDGQPADPERWANAPWDPTLYTAAIENGGEPRPLPSE